MPRPGGEAGKLGNQFEAVWTVDAAIDVFEGRFKSITVEAFGDESLGVEFHLENSDGSLQFHSVKRQKQDGDWSIADLCSTGGTSHRSYLGDLLGKHRQWPNAQTRFISSTGANDLRELSERSAAPMNLSEFKSILSAKLRTEFDSRIVPMCGGDPDVAFAALKGLEVIPRGHADLIRTVERRIDGLFYRTDGSRLLAADVRRMIAEFILENLGPKIERDRLRDFFRDKGMGVRDWKMDPTANDLIAAANRRFLSEAETELINSAQISRDVVGQIIDKIADPESHGVLLVAPGGFGKSCVLAQCLSQLKLSGTPYLCLRMDSFNPCSTARQLGEQMDLSASPAVVLAGIADESPSVLVVDQLDAMSLVSGRNPQMWDVFLDLCTEVRSYSRMKMILACRDFDLEHDHRLRRLADRRSGFARFQLEKLTTTEVHSCLNTAGHGVTLNSRQLEILGIPFHMLLFLQGDPSRGFSTVGELYDRYWLRKRQNLKKTLGRDPYWNDVINALTTSMSDRQLLFAPASVTDDWELDALAMASEHVLIKISNQRQYRFFHESFFDYAYARRFCSTGRNIHDFLESSEQHLFRRAQVRQILAYRRDNDFDQYITDVRGIFDSTKIRFHIKRMVASGFNRIEQPAQEEWRVIEPYLLDGDLSRYVSSALRDHVGWFDLLDSLRVFKQWLASDDSRLNNAAIWYLEAHGLHDKRSVQIANLISPYSNREGDWRQRFQRIMSWGQAHKSDEMAAIYLGLVADGVYDNYENSGGSDFWSQHYGAEKESPRFVIDVLRTWFDRAVEQYDDGESWNFLDKCPLNHSHTGAMMIGNAAAAEPEYFVNKLLPRVRATVLRTEDSRTGEVRNRAWPWLSNHGEPFDINDAVLLSLRKSLQHLALHNVDAFRRYAATIETQPHQTFGYLLLRSWANNPIEFANECAEYIIADQRRLNIGYSSWSGGGEGESAISRIALQAISPHCSSELLQRLETQIIGYCDEYEKQTPRWRGYSELVVLRSLERSRVSKRVTLRIEELERKFPKLQNAIAKEDDTTGAKCVTSPIEQGIAERMSDSQWISAMRKYDGTTDRFRGGPIELSRPLAEFARKERKRFAALVAMMPKDVAPVYFSAILDGICSRYTNLGTDEKDADQKSLASTATAVFVSVIDRLHELPNRPCGSAIAGCIRQLSDRQLPPRMLQIVSHYAIYDPDPQTDIWQDTSGGRNYYGGDPHFHGINCVRGQAAQALSSLLYDDPSRLDALRPALIALSEDPVISVRSCAIDAISPLLNFNRDLAVQLFLNTCGRCELICATHSFDHFVHYAIHTHYEPLRDLLQFALSSNIPKAIENTARQIILADLDGVAVATDAAATDAAEIRIGSEAMRKAAADVYAFNLKDETEGNKCAERLEEFFSDPSEIVRKEVSSAFFNLSGKRLLQLKEIIARYIESPCFEQETNQLLHALKESNVQLPEIICRAAERILEFLGEEGTHIAYHGSMVAHDISSLVVRQYQQSADDNTKKRCLDLIDRMERVGYLGIGEELAKVDR